jgi:aminoglycoside phosphotransferase (APT) family kinase protein
MTYSITDETIRAIWRAHELGDVERIEGATSGVSNRSFIVNDGLVIRFNTSDLGVPKFENERVAYALLAERGAPVPSVIALDTSRRIVPYDYIILTRLPGANLAESWQGLEPAQVRRLAREAGAWLARLHMVSLPAFGKVHEQGAPRFRSWPDYFDDYADRYMNAAEQFGMLDATVRARLQGVLDGAHNMLAQVTEGVLVHSDYHYENILQDAGRLTGILDFEWALSGDPSYDFMAAGERERQAPGSEQAFMEGYRSLRPLDAEHNRRLAIYLLFFQVENIVAYARQDRARESRAALAEMIERLEAIEAS